MRPSRPRRSISTLVLAFAASACGADPGSEKIASLDDAERDTLCSGLEHRFCIEADVIFTVIPSEEDCKRLLADFGDSCDVTVGQFQACVDDAKDLTSNELCYDLPTSCEPLWHAFNGTSCR